MHEKGDDVGIICYITIQGMRSSVHIQCSSPSSKACLQNAESTVEEGSHEQGVKAGQDFIARLGKVQFQPGTEVRRFLEVPEGATWGEMTLKAGNHATPRYALSPPGIKALSICLHRNSFCCSLVTQYTVLCLEPTSRGVSTNQTQSCIDFGSNQTQSCTMFAETRRNIACCLQKVRSILAWSLLEPNAGLHGVCRHSEPSCMMSAGTSCCGQPRSCPIPGTATQKHVHTPV